MDSEDADQTHIPAVASLAESQQMEQMPGSFVSDVDMAGTTPASNSGFIILFIPVAIASGSWRA